jgi:hypothetical protein
MYQCILNVLVCIVHSAPISTYWYVCIHLYAHSSHIWLDPNDILRAQDTTDTPQEPLEFLAVQPSQQLAPRWEFEIPKKKNVKEMDQNIKSVQISARNLGFSDIHCLGLNHSDEKPSDDHHSKSSSEHYVALRLDQVIQFYQHRLSRNQFKNAVSIFLLIAASAAWILFSVTDKAGLIAVCAVISAAVTSWIRTRGIEYNLVRYRNCLKRLQDLRSKHKSIEFNTLVQNVEQVMSLINFCSYILACKGLKKNVFLVDKNCQ